MNSSKNKLPELLAPAGSPESLRAAVNAGADAVYTGGRRFGARAYADNADEEQLLAGIRYAHLFGVRVHLTVNTLMKDGELSGLPSYVEPFFEAGLDAAIVQDIGAFSLLRRRFPRLPLHASTQTAVTGAESGLFFKKLGAVRLIPARELSLAELTELKKKTGLEIECFVHGALCYAYSGQCLMSSLIGGRSGNRGRCAQPCRLPYALMSGGKRVSAEREARLLSCRDLCSLDLVPELIAAGIDSFKLEGRMKSPRYTAGVVEIWRRYLDLYGREGAEGYAVDPRDRKRFLELFDRGGQTEGYYFQHNGREMLALAEKPEFRAENKELSERLDREYVRAERKLSIRGRARFAAGKAMTLRLCCAENGAEAEASGPPPERARTRGASEEEIRGRLMKTGGTPFLFSALSIEAEEELFLPVAALNALRRDALQALEEKILSEKRRSGGEEGQGSPAALPPCRRGGRIRSLHVSCESGEQLAVALSFGEVREISLDAGSFPAEEWSSVLGAVREKGKRAYLRMPQIFREEARAFFERNAELLVSSGADGLVLCSLEEPGFFRELYEREGAALPPFCFDFQVYGMNREALRVLEDSGAFRLTLPVELNAAELSELGCGGRELVVAGRLPMMASAQCLKKTAKGCDHVPETLFLKDRRGMEMPVKNDCVFCCNRILNALPLSLAGMRESVLRLAPASVRILLTTESGAQSRRVIRSCADAFLLGREAEEPYESFTRGHMRRGVQ